MHTERCFSSAILRLAGVGLPITQLQSRQVEIVSPFAKLVCTKPEGGESVLVPFLPGLSLLSVIRVFKYKSRDQTGV
jgi:hypothetical protein